jgi:hypothetical protein
VWAAAPGSERVVVHGRVQKAEVHAVACEWNCKPFNMSSNPDICEPISVKRCDLGEGNPEKAQSGEPGEKSNKNIRKSKNI